MERLPSTTQRLFDSDDDDDDFLLCCALSNISLSILSEIVNYKMQYFVT